MDTGKINEELKDIHQFEDAEYAAKKLIAAGMDRNASIGDILEAMEILDIKIYDKTSPLIFAARIKQILRGNVSKKDFVYVPYVPSLRLRHGKKLRFENLSFREYFNEFHYLMIGHNRDTDIDAYVLKRNSNDIILAKKVGEDPDYFHDKHLGKLDFSGRIDHDKKMISIVTQGGNEERLNYLISILKNDYPGYAIWDFGSGFGEPDRIA